jgi:PAS domain S-box-containing protein
VETTGPTIQQVERIILSLSGESHAAAAARSSVREVARLLGASRAILAFFDADGRTESVTRFAIGAALDETPSLRDDEQFIRTAYTDERPTLATVGDPIAYAAVAVPCRPGYRVVGAIGAVLASPDRKPTPQEITALGTIGTMATIIIENARLGETIQRSAIADADLSQQWHGLVEAEPTDMIYVTDMEGRIIDANQAACRSLGYTKHELIHRGIADIVPSPAGQEDQGLLAGLIMQILAGNITQFESALLAKSGRVLSVQVHCKPVEIEGQTAIISVATDVSERKGAETQLVQTQRLRALGEMAAGVVHDINNMLTAALGPIEIILATTDDRVTRNLLPGVQQALLDGAQTVRRIQDFARQSQTGRTAFVKSDLTHITHDVVELIRPRWQTQARQSGINFDVVATGTGPQVILGNPVELREMLVNLVNNAIDAMPTGGRVELSTESRGSSVILKVSDTGVGMPPEVIQRIFDPFFTTKGVHGSGLGLSVVYGIVARHHGEITVDSQPGRGTTFTMVFPSGAPETETAVADVEPTEVVAAVPSGERLLNVLVVDDQPQVAAVLKLMLEIDGHQVQFYTSGAAALSALDDLPWDLVCTDIDMPGMSGWEVARAVKERFTDLPVVVVTGWTERYSPAELKQRGVNSVLNKPYQISNIRELVELVRAGSLA